MPVTITQLGSILTEWRLDQRCEITEWASRLMMTGLYGSAEDNEDFLANAEHDLWTRDDSCDAISAFLDAMARALVRPGMDEIRLRRLYQAFQPHLCRLLAVPAFTP